MHVVLRLQNHGCRNHPLWWIVVAPRLKNIKGRFIEHIGYWIPFKRKTVQRSIIINKRRALYWLAMGAQPTKRVHKCLSHIDLMPKPLIKHGVGTLYEKEKKVMSINHFHQLQPYKSAYEKKYINQIIEKEDENLLKREMMMTNEVYIKGQNINTEQSITALEEEWDKLRAELYQMEKDYKIIDPIKREIQFRRINQISEQWKNQKEISEYKRLKQFNQPLEQGDIKKQMIIQNMIQKQEVQMEDKKKWFDELKPISEGQLKEFLNTAQQMKYLRFDDKEDMFNEIISHASRLNIVITRFFLNDYLDNRIQRRENSADIVRIANSKNLDETEHSAIISRITIHPIPDITKYDPDDYTDIKKQSETLNKNKAYSVPNIYLENDQAGSLRQKDLNQRVIYKAKTGRSAKLKTTSFFRFSSSKNDECKQIIDEQERFMSLRRLLNIIL